MLHDTPGCLCLFVMCSFIPSLRVPLFHQIPPPCTLSCRLLFHKMQFHPDLITYSLNVFPVFVSSTISLVLCSDKTVEVLWKVHCWSALTKTLLILDSICILWASGLLGRIRPSTCTVQKGHQNVALLIY